MAGVFYKWRVTPTIRCSGCGAAWLGETVELETEYRNKQEAVEDPAVPKMGEEVPHKGTLCIDGKPTVVGYSFLAW